MNQTKLETVFSGIAGQKILITAGASGIGYAIAETLHGLGAKLMICDISEDALDKAQERLEGLETIKADVSNEADVAQMFEKLENRLGGLDALINNAGIAGPTGGVEDISPQDWRKCLDVCLTGQFH